MPFSNYTELQASIQGWLWDRSEIAARAPDFIRLCEVDLNQRLRHRRMIKRVDATFTQGRYPLPTDWLEAKGVRIEGGRQLLPSSQENLAEITLARSDSTDPVYYDLIGDEIEIAPAPTSAVIQLLYYAEIPPLATNSTNWLLTRHPDIYLYGSLVHSAPYMSEDERLATWVGAYDRLLAMVNENATRAERSGGPLQRRMRTFG